MSKPLNRYHERRKGRICQFVFLLSSILVLGCSGNNVVKVKNSILPFDKSLTIGQALDGYNYFIKTSWEEHREGDREFVIFKGYFDTALCLPLLTETSQKWDPNFTDTPRRSVPEDTFWETWRMASSHVTALYVRIGFGVNKDGTVERRRQRICVDLDNGAAICGNVYSGLNWLLSCIYRGRPPPGVFNWMCMPTHRNNATVAGLRLIENTITALGMGP